MNSIVADHTTDNVHMAAEVPLPSLIRQQMQELAGTLLQRYSLRFGAAQINVRLKSDGPMIACFLSLHTDDGRYHSQASDWDVRAAVNQALDGVETQIVKHFQKRLVHA